LSLQLQHISRAGRFDVRGSFFPGNCACDQVPLTAGNIGLVARTGQPHISRNVDSDPSYRSCFAGVNAEAVMPVRSTDQTIGIVDVEASDGAGLNVAAITAFAADIAALLANAT
jgi:putative methionine-R-sulfoxide reductase with GAF domain